MVSALKKYTKYELLRVIPTQPKGGNMLEIKSGSALSDRIAQDELDVPFCDKIAINPSMVFGQEFSGVRHLTKEIVKIVLYKPDDQVCKHCKRCL